MGTRGVGGGTLCAWGLAWWGGLVLHLQAVVLPSRPALVVAMAIGLAGLLAAGLAARHAAVARVVSRHGRWAAAAPILAALSLASLAWGQAGWRAADRLDDGLPASLEGIDLHVAGVIDGLPDRTPTGWRFVLEVSAATLDGRRVRVPRRVALSWSAERPAPAPAALAVAAFREAAGGALGEPPQPEAAPALPTLRAAERWSFVVRLRQPHGARNPHGNDAELWWFEQGIRALGSVRRAIDLGPAPPAQDGWRPVDRLRQALRDGIESRIGEPRVAGLVAALAIGDQAAIEADDWALFRTTGVAHLMSISGLHVTMFAWLAAAVMAALWRRHPRAPLWCPAPVAARWGGLAAAFGYALVAGWGLPAQRTVGMLAAMVVLQQAGGRWPWPLVLLAAGVVVSAGDPWALLQAGFWLSFSAVGLLMAASPVRERQVPPPGAGAGDGRSLAAAAAGSTVELLRTQAVVTIGLAPLTVLLFQQVSVVGLLANLLAIPWVSFVVTPLALLGALWSPVWSLAAVSVQALIAVLEPMAAWPGAVWTVAAATGTARVLGLAAGLLAVMPLPWRVRLLALPLALPMLWPAVERPAPGGFDLLAADIGQGTAVIVRTQHHVLLYDSGPTYGPHGDAGGRVLLPLLRALGIQRLDTLVLSHRDSDHTGGAASLLEAMPVAGVTSSLEAAHPLRARIDVVSSHRRCESGQQWEWDGVRFELLHPPADELSRDDRRPNALSCVLRISGGGRSALLAGDIERLQELALLDRHPARLPSELLLVPHHGSRTSSSEAWLDGVAPRLAVVQAGHRNRFGHPAPEVVERYRRRGIAVFDSASCGALRWPVTGSTAEVQCERDRSRRYWHHPTRPPPDDPAAGTPAAGNAGPRPGSVPEARAPASDGAR